MLKKMQEISIKPIAQLWNHCCRRSKPEAGQAVRRDECFLSLARIDNLYHELW